MPITRLTPENNYPYLQDRLEALKQAVPEAFADGKINWDTLREALGENLEDEAREEFFGLNWPGKREARKRAAVPSRGTLVPAPGEGVNEDTTENLFIEGDNLEVLKLLQKSYAGRIKMIYIDPPYNTGNDFIYNDNFTDPLEAYLQYTGAKGEGGELLTTNTRADGRFHSKWLNMMYPRLILARQLLREDGVIFVSIDDNEIHNLRQILNEIFGEENFLGCIVRATGTTTGQDSSRFGNSFDYVLTFSKSNKFELGGLPLSEEDEARFSEEDEKGQYSLLQMRKTGNADRREDRPSMFYAVIDPDGQEVFPIGPGGYESRWRFGYPTYQQYNKDNLIVWKKRNSNGKELWAPYVKFYLEGRMKRPSPLWTDIEGNKKATIELRSLFGEKIFDNPKPTQMIKRMLEIVTSGENREIILDFFAGSCTTAQAIIEMNNGNKNNRNFIVVQIPEKVDNGPFSTIAEIGKERIRRVITSIESRISEEASKTPLLQNDQTQLDLGFKVFKYTCSNYKQWNSMQEESTEDLTPLFNNLSDPLILGWKKEELLSEILLLEGFPLTSQITYFEELHKNQVYRVSAPDICAHDLFVCLDQIVQPVTIDLITMEKEDIFICLDSALSDELKARLQDRFNLHVI